MISNSTINNLINYFKAKESLTQEESEMLEDLEFHKDAFPITAVTRDDLEERGFDTSKITDKQMSDLARKMADDYCEQLFWESMETLADCMGFPTK